MLKYGLTHPELIGALAGTGHTSRILLADSNYPVDVNANPAAKRIYLNFAPGMLTATDILKVILDAIPIEAAHYMLMDDGHAPPIADEFRHMLPQQASLDALARADFYNAVKESRTSIVVATGEQRLYANLLLTVGYIQPDGKPHF